MRRALLLLAALALPALPGCARRPPGAEPPHAALARRLGGRRQERRLGCEAQSASALLAAHGIPVPESALLARLPRSDNPDLGFVGDPDGEPGRLPPEGYGVHAEPVAAVLRSFGLEARAERGRDLTWLRGEVSSLRPVVVWVTADLVRDRPVALADSRGRRFLACRGEHTMLAVGATRREVALLDPADGRVRLEPWEDLDASWALLGRMAVSATGPAGR